MSKLKTYVPGEPFTAAQINANLTTEVPPSAVAIYRQTTITPSDSNLTTPEPLVFTRQGLLVTFTGRIGVTSANYLSVYRNIATDLPAEFRPTSIYAATQFGTVEALISINSAGSFQIRSYPVGTGHPSNAQFYLQGSYAVFA